MIVLPQNRTRCKRKKMKRREKLISKALAMVLSLVMLLSMSITVFADSLKNDTTGSFTVNGLDGSAEKSIKVTAYKIIDVNIDDASGKPANPTYKWNESVATWVQNNYSSYIGEDKAVIGFESIDTTTMDAFLQSMTAQIKNNSITPPCKTVLSTGASATFGDMQMGVYLLTVSGGVKLYQRTTVELLPVENNGNWEIDSPVTVTMKSNNPTIVKDVTDPDKTVAIGDTVNYKLTVDIPDYPADATAMKLVVKDRLSEGLTFNSESIKVYLGTTISDDKIVGADNYDFNSPLDDGNYDFEMNFKENFIKANTGGKLTITYNATVNEYAFIKDALGNTAFIGYNSDPYNEDSYKEKTDNEKVYTYGIQLTKFKEDEGTKTAISGAQFTLTDDDSTELKFTRQSDGVYVLDNTNGDKTVEVASNGELLLQGLDVGVYVLKETKAPSGCMLPSGEITITITEDDPEDGIIDFIDVTTSGSSETDSEEIEGNIIKFDVINHDSTFTLPETGGMGTMLFTILGISLMAGAVAMLIAISRKRKA